MGSPTAASGTATATAPTSRTRTLSTSPYRCRGGVLTHSPTHSPCLLLLCYVDTDLLTRNGLRIVEKQHNIIILKGRLISVSVYIRPVPHSDYLREKDSHLKLI